MNELQHKLFGETAARKQRLFELQKNHTSKVLNTEERSVLSQLELILQRELQTLEKMEISLNLLVQSFV
jgi:RNA polymerase-interacting CarD/CdnL/TRCF family regulator